MTSLWIVKLNHVLKRLETGLIVSYLQPRLIEPDYFSSMTLDSYIMAASHWGTLAMIAEGAT